MKNEDKKNIPRIRFKGFTDAWEQRKLGEIGTTFTGLSGKTALDFGHGDAFFITYMNVFSNPITNPKLVEKIEVDKKQTEVRVGDVFFTTSSETPEDVGMSSVLKAKNGITYLNSFCFGFRPSIKFELGYLAFMLRSESVRKQIKLLSQGISRYNISKIKMMDINIQIAQIKEQSLIGGYFSNLDNLITLQQRKLDEIKKLKKTLLQKMFPKKDENIPEIRFKGFNDAWEQRRLKSFLKIPKKEIIYIKSYDDLITVKLNLGGVQIGSSRETLSIGSTTYYKRKKNQLIYGKQNFFNGSIAIVPEIADGKGTSGDVPSFDIININIKYLYYYISRENYWKSKESISTGTGSKRIHEKDFLKFEICVPEDNEQIKISQLIDKIDLIITLQQRKIDQLKLMKKTLLKNMFV